MKNIVLQFLTFLTMVLSLQIYSQSDTKKSAQEENKIIYEVFDKKGLVKVSFSSESNKTIEHADSKSRNSIASPEGWVNIKTEDFEGTFPNEWDVYAADGYTDAYWDKILLSDNIHYAGYCAAGGTESSTWSAGYPDYMRTWMIYGPFDLSDASDAVLEFIYFLDCEVVYDTLRWLASSDGIYFYGTVKSDSSSTFQWISENFDLKNVPVIGNLTGKSGIYIAFLFKSDESNYGRTYRGAVIDDIVLKKFTSGSSYPTTFSINKTFSFAGLAQSNYRMIGLPGSINYAVSQVVSGAGTQKQDWNVYYDNGAAENYLLEYDGSTTFAFKPGNGFWMLSKNAVNVNMQVSTVNLAGDNTYSISLHSGWNIISNPFERSTSWLDVRNANGLGVNTVIYDWDGTWNTVQTFFPYKGYYFNNTGGLTSLKIPYDPNGTLGKSTGEDQIQISGENDIKFSLNLDGEEKSKVFIGYNPKSSDDYDIGDYFAPPGDFEEARIVIRNEHLSTDYKYLMKESRSEIGEGQTYNLEFKNISDQDVTLEVERKNLDQNYLMFLFDERLNNAVKLSANAQVKMPAHIKHNNYKLLIGTRSFIDANIKNIAPTEFVLYQNYPNPFNPATKIRFTIASEVKGQMSNEGTNTVNTVLKVFDVLGRQVATLVDEPKAPGVYEVEFSAGSLGDAPGLASGFYIYKIQAGTFTANRKMMLLR
jgi:hypothetical protein